MDETKRVLRYPYVTLDHLPQLPDIPGIYYAVRGKHILYIGLSKSLYTRWNAKGKRKHHKLRKLKQMNRTEPVKIHYRGVSENSLRYQEALELQLFNPPLNDQIPDPANYAPEPTSSFSFQENHWVVEYFCNLLFLLAITSISVALYRDREELWNRFKPQFQSVQTQSPVLKTIQRTVWCEPGMNGLSFFTEPDTVYGEKIAIIPCGQTVQFLERLELGWAKIQYNDRMGWVDEYYLN